MTFALEPIIINIIIFILSYYNANQFQLFCVQVNSKLIPRIIKFKKYIPISLHTQYKKNSEME